MHRLSLTVTVLPEGTSAQVPNEAHEYRTKCHAWIALRLCLSRARAWAFR